ncbi:MAG: hypothetical protein QM635_04680 [Microbacteriaceae bacterium]
MELTGVGSGVMLAIAAALWMVYLVPTWLRRREYNATERNAVRLQQTLRVLAETAEAPEAVHAEASARSAAQQARLLRARQRAEAAEARAMAIAAAATREHDTRVRAARRLRRTRAATSLVLLVALLALVVALVVIAAGGASIVTAWSVFLGLLGVVLSVSMLRRLALVHRRLPATTRPVLSKRTSGAVVATPSLAEPVREWTPVPVPRPLYLSRADTAVRTVPARRDDELLAASARAQERLRAAHVESEVVPMPAAARAAAVSGRAASGNAVPGSAGSPPAGRLAAVGRVEKTASLGGADLDEVLRRRRAVG